MIKRYFLAFVLCLYSTFGFCQSKGDAKGFGFDFQDVSLPKAVATVYGHTLGESYLIDQNVENVPITFMVKSLSPDALRQVFDDYLLSRGIKRIVSGGVNLFVKAPKDAVADVVGFPVSAKAGTVAAVEGGKDLALTSRPVNQEVYVYKPKYRDAVDLYRIVAPLLGGGTGGSVGVVSGTDQPPSFRGGSGGAYLDQILLVGDRVKVDLAKSVLTRFDVPSDMVLVRASVVEYQTSEDSGAGFAGAVKALGNSLTLSIGDTAGVLPNFARVTGSTFDLVVSAISQDSRFGILDTASIRVVSGKVGSLNVGQEVPTLGAVTIDQAGRPVQSVNYRTSGLTLTVKPYVSTDSVRADVEQVISSFAQTTTSTINSPTMLKRQISTSLSANFGEVLVLGGLDESKDSSANSGLFGVNFSKSKTKLRSTVFVVLEFGKV